MAPPLRVPEIGDLRRVWGEMPTNDIEVFLEAWRSAERSLEGDLRETHEQERLDAIVAAARDAYLTAVRQHIEAQVIEDEALGRLDHERSAGVGRTNGHVVLDGSERSSMAGWRRPALMMRSRN